MLSILALRFFDIAVPSGRFLVPRRISIKSLRTDAPVGPDPAPGP